jgi:hypothetical protein
MQHLQTVQSSARATEQRLAERRAASGARLKPDVDMAFVVNEGELILPTAHGG